MNHYNRERFTAGKPLATSEKLPIVSTMSSLSQDDTDKRWRDALNANKFVKELKKKKHTVKKTYTFHSPPRNNVAKGPALKIFKEIVNFS